MQTLTPQVFRQRYAEVASRVAAAARSAGRDPGGVRIVAVTKRFPAAVVEAAYAAGMRDFGENYASELGVKAPQLPTDIRWHLIGPVQRRFVPRLLGLELLVHSLDRIAVVDRFYTVMPEAMPPFLIQVNIGREPQKAGIAPDTLPAFLDELAAHAARPRLLGLMAIPPAAEDPECTRPYFAALRDLGERMAAQLGLTQVELSMGMSSDYEVAVAEGATIVRIGTALFGERS